MNFCQCQEFGVIFQFCLEKNLFALGGHPQPLQKALSKSKGLTTSINDTKTLEVAKSAKEKGNIFNHLWAVAVAEACTKANVQEPKPG